LAIGTDIPNNTEIDRQGGSLLILAEIFAKRIEDQAQGRVGRFNS
jgi:hypothetical protein